jgi:prepilin-type N-terminal cleavage/methylation domain-containing protein
MKTERTGRRGEAGFSLVEVTLALLVVAVGMTAAFSLFPEGIQSTRSAVDNTETALFADYVFATLELAAGVKCLAGNVEPSSLPEEADYFKSIAFSKKARDEHPEYFELRTSSGKPKTFYWMPDYFGLDGVEDMKASYFEGKLKTAAFTYTLTLDKAKWKGSGGVPMVAVLKVWPGEYGEDVKTSDLKDKDARIFYREILPVK